MAGMSSTGPGAIRLGSHAPVVLNGDRTAAERLTLVIENTGDRPVQIGSHLHLPDSNSALAFDRAAARGFRLDIPSGTSRRFEPGASATVDAVALRGLRRVPGIQRDKTAADVDVSRGSAGSTGSGAPGSSGARRREEGLQHG